MANKLILDAIQSGYSTTTQLNDNFQDIEEEFEQVLYRSNPDGTDNSMYNDLDMNSNRIINASALSASTITLNGVTRSTWQVGEGNVLLTDAEIKAAYEANDNVLGPVNFTDWQDVAALGFPGNIRVAEILFGSGRGTWIYTQTPAFTANSRGDAAGTAFQATGDTSGGLWARKFTKYEPNFFLDTTDVDDTLSVQATLAEEGVVRWSGQYTISDKLQINANTKSITVIPGCKITSTSSSLDYMCQLTNPDQFTFHITGTLYLDCNNLTQHAMRINGCTGASGTIYGENSTAESIVLEHSSGYGIYSNNFYFVTRESGGGNLTPTRTRSHGLVCRNVDGTYDNGVDTWTLPDPISGNPEQTAIDYQAALDALNTIKFNEASEGVWTGGAYRCSANTLQLVTQRNSGAGAFLDYFQGQITVRTELNILQGIWIDHTRQLDVIGNYAEHNGDLYDNSSAVRINNGTLGSDVFIDGSVDAKGVKILGGRTVSKVPADSQLRLNNGWYYNSDTDTVEQDARMSFNDNVTIKGILQGKFQGNVGDIPALTSVSVPNTTREEMGDNSWWLCTALDNGAGHAMTVFVHLVGATGSVNSYEVAQAPSGTSDLAITYNPAGDGAVLITNVNASQERTSIEYNFIRLI